MPVVKNFRQASSLPRIYRCASTDPLATLFEGDSDSPGDFSPGNILGRKESAEHVLLQRAGLVVDLRSPSERDEVKAGIWMNRAFGGQLSVRYCNAGLDRLMEIGRPGRDSERMVLRIDVLSPSRLFSHLKEQWLNPAERALYALYYTFDTSKLHELRMEALNRNGLAGLYEAIIQTSGRELCASLMAITNYLETSIQDDNHDAVVVHCVQGKDRTGLVIMLCQAILGISDDEIILDYSKSDQMREGGEGSAAVESIRSKSLRKGKLDRRVFSGAPRDAMSKTLGMIRARYGSVSPGYLDSIGFCEQWRCRLRSALLRGQSFPPKLKSKL